MVGVIIACHGKLGEELLNAATSIVGEMPEVRTVSITCRECSPTAKLGSLIDELDHGQGVLVLVDVFGGSPSQAACSLLTDKRVEVVSGVNLPMVVKLATLRKDDGPNLPELARQLTSYGQKHVLHASDLVRSYTAASAANATGSGAAQAKGS